MNARSSHRNKMNMQNLAAGEHENRKMGEWGEGGGVKREGPAKRGPISRTIEFWKEFG